MNSILRRHGRGRCVVVGGYHTTRMSRAELASQMVRDCQLARTNPLTIPPRLVFSSNMQGVALGGGQEEFRRAMAQADIVHADGMPIVFASRLIRNPIAQRCATTDFFHDAAAVAIPNKLSFFMLGATDAQNARACARIKELYPDLKLAGRHHGYFDSQLDEEICEMVRASGADVLWLAMGKPKQELWAVRNQHMLRGLGWIKTCGGLYAFLAGDVTRAPVWMQRMGLEWVYRTLQEPRRLAKRNLTTGLAGLKRVVLNTHSCKESD